jgi:hypothetical protein
MKTKKETSPMLTGARRARQERQHGANAVCKQCGETDVRVLVRNSRPKRCEACYRAKNGKSVEDAHHPSGRANSPFIVQIPVNSHRRLSDKQYDWPSGLLQNPNDCPIMSVAAQVRGATETLVELIERLLMGVADFLIVLSDRLSEHLGDEWWITILGSGSPFSDVQNG